MSPRRAACEFLFLVEFFDFFSSQQSRPKKGRSTAFFSRRRRLTACVIIIVICSVLTHSWIPSLSVACLNVSVLLACCLCLVVEHLLNLVIVPTSGTCSTAVLTTQLKVVEARVPRSVIEWFPRSFSIYREDPMLRVLNSFSFDSEVDVLLHGDSVVQQYVVFSPPDVRQRISV